MASRCTAARTQVNELELDEKERPSSPNSCGIFGGDECESDRPENINDGISMNNQGLIQSCKRANSHVRNMIGIRDERLAMSMDRQN